MKIPFNIFVFKMWKKILFFLCYSWGIYVAHAVWKWEFLTIPFASIGTLGTALAIMVAFRFRVSYERWWESRSLWGGITNSSRTLCRQIISFVPDDSSLPSAPHPLVERKRELVMNLIGFVHALKQYLLEKTDLGSLKSYLQLSDLHVESWKGHTFLPAVVLQELGRKVLLLRQEKLLGGIDYLRIDSTMAELCNLMGGCEKIRWTPVPHHYGNFMKWLLFLFSLCLPLSLVKDMGPSVIFFTCINYMIFESLEIIGQRTETPFGHRVTDIQMAKISADIEKCLWQQWDLWAGPNAGTPCP